MSSPILIIEDDKTSAKWIEVYLTRAGYTSILAMDGITGLEIARKESPSLIVLDLMLPGLNGMEICRILRRESDVPIIMLTARGAKSDKIEGLDLGADDYLVKPVDPDELVVRIKSVLRRYRGQVVKINECGNIRLNDETREITVEGKIIGLSNAQYALMAVFIGHPNMVLSRSQLIRQAFNNNFESFDRAIDSHIRRLRKLIHSKDFKPLKTIYGLGYKLECPER